MLAGNRARHLAAVVVAGLACAMMLAGVSHAQRAEDAVALDAKVEKLYREGKYPEAIEIAKRVLAIRERALGPEHADVRTALNNLAELYRLQGRYAEAEPLYRRSLAIREKTLGPEHADVGTALNNLALLYSNQGRYAEAEPLYRRSLAIREKALGPEHLHVGFSLHNMAELYRLQGRYAEAEPLYRRSLAIREKALGPEHPDVAATLNNLAGLYQTQGRYAEAEALYRRSLAIREKALGPEHPDVGTTLNNLAVLYQDQGRYSEADPLYRRSLAIREKALGPEHPRVGTSLNNLAELYRDQGRYAEAEPLYRRTVAIFEKALGPEHPDVGTALNNLSLLFRDQGRYAEAEPLYRRIVAIFEKTLGPEHPSVGTALNNLAWLYDRQGRYAEVEPLFKRALAIREKTLGPEHPLVASTLSGLAGRYHTQSRYAEAEALYRRSLAIREKVLGSEHPLVASTLNDLAWLALAPGDWGQAADYWRRSTGVIQRRAQRGLASAAESTFKGETQRLGWQFAGLVKTTYRLATQGRVEVESEGRVMFETAQWAQGSEAAASLAQMAARSAKGSPHLGILVRERQDLVNELQAKDKLLIAAKSEEPAKRNTTAEKVLSDRLAAIDARLGAVDARLANDFPDHVALASPAPVSVAEVQAQLGADEALVLFFDTDARFGPLLEETFIWVVTRAQVRWVDSELGTAGLSREVAALRCGLDASAWDAGGTQRCASLLGIGLDKVPRDNDPLPFDHARAHALYKALFGQVEDLIKGKHLLIVPSGPLTQLPLQVLVTTPPEKTDQRAIAWLARSHAITVLPAVSSLKALRRVARPSGAPKPMIGFVNPLLDGDQSHLQWGVYYKQQAQLARDKQACALASTQRVAVLRAARTGIAPIATRDARVANLAHLKMQTPLPETADELCAVGRALGVDSADMRIGARASEREVKALSESGALAQYRIVHFATHGALAGQLLGTSEPGLLLTPPDTATSEDDGYLSASEVAGLKLDADWVILSACNTAAGGASDAEALSGLARAFIYAQARALLVSHWAVDSDATVGLITGTVDAMTSDPRIGRAEALRRAMLALIDKGEPHQAHPYFWAPFVVVGEGGPAR